MAETTFALSALDWALRTLAFFNTMAALWLSLTVLLNAERRVWGTWLAGGGLLLGGLFFAGHATVVSREFGIFDGELDFWWRVSWLPFIAAPYLWYLVMAWYTTLWHQAWHRVWLVGTSVWGLAAVTRLLFGNPLPSYGDLAGIERGAAAGPELLAISVLYPGYSVVCILLALVALARPAEPERFMGGLAQRRARPWLVASSFMLLGVSLIVGGLAVWFLGRAAAGEPLLAEPDSITLLKLTDLIILALLAVTIGLVGRAIVSYEIFTGRTLPRRGLFRQWRNSLVLAATCSGLLAASFLVPVGPGYRPALALALLAVAYALLSWHSYSERQQSMAALRPFVASQRLYEHLRAGSAADVDATELLRALCDQVLGARVAHLVTVGPLAPLVGPTLSHPPGVTAPSPPASDLLPDLDEAQPICTPVDPATHGGAGWAVPLWSERGPNGVLLLGEKRDGSLYTQEEIELARATGERLIDTRASAEMARRLIGLERQRLAESQVLDQNARRILHDDVLPRLHTAMLQLDGDQAGSRGTTGVVALLGQIHHQLASLLISMPTSLAPEVDRLGFVAALRQVVEGELASCFDAVSWELDPPAIEAVDGGPRFAGDVLFCAAREALRNAARHGRGSDLARQLRAAVCLHWDGDHLRLSVEDDGVGFSSGAPSSAGGGQGLALHSTLLTIIGGTLAVQTSPAGGTRVVLTLPGSVCARP